jgi:transposase-like protein
MTRPIVRDPICRRRRFDAEIIELCVVWYITYRLSYRDLVAMMAERGITVSRDIARDSYRTRREGTLPRGNARVELTSLSTGTQS